MQTDPIHVNGIAGPVVVVGSRVPFRNSDWRVTVGGQSARQVRPHRFALPTADGGTALVTLRFRLTDPYPIVDVNGWLYRTGPDLPAWLKVLAFLPLPGLAAQPVIGMAIFALLIAVKVNLSILYRQDTAAKKALMMVGVSVASGCLAIGVRYLTAAFAGLVTS